MGAARFTKFFRLMSGTEPTDFDPPKLTMARHGRLIIRGGVMTGTRSEYFDPESVARMCAALDEAWRSLPATRQTPETKNALAKAIVHLAAAGESDPDHLSRRAFGVVIGALLETYDFEVLNDDDDTIAMIRSVIQDSKELWPRIAELAKIYAPGCRIRVTDQSGEMVILVGVTTARRAILMR